MSDTPPQDDAGEEPDDDGDDEVISVRPLGHLVMTDPGRPAEETRSGKVKSFETSMELCDPGASGWAPPSDEWDGPDDPWLGSNM